MTVLDRTQDVLCKKLGDHFVRLCLNEEEGGDLEQQLIPVFYELLNLKWLLKAFELYRGKAEEQLKEVMNSVMTICLGKERWGESAVLSPSASNPQCARDMPHRDFLGMLDILFEQFLKIATRSRQVLTVSTNILATIPTQQTPYQPSSLAQGVSVEDALSITSAEQATLQQCVGSLHTHTWSHMQQLVGTLLESRGEVHAQLPIEELRQVWDHCMDFVAVAGKLYGTKGKLLLGTLLRQARDSLEFVHKDQLVRLQGLLHEELWKPALVPSVLQGEVTQLEENPRVGVGVWSDEQTAGLNAQDASTSERGGAPSRIDVISARPRLVISGKSFCVTFSLLELVRMVFNYLLYARAFQGLGPEVMHRVLDLFKLYNNSSRSLVLNAGAVSQGFLKRISARHLGPVSSLSSLAAITTQCLSACMEFVTLTQTALILFIPASQHCVLTELMKGVGVLMEDHRTQVFAKFPEIIRSVAEKTCSELDVGGG